MKHNADSNIQLKTTWSCIKKPCYENNYFASFLSVTMIAFSANATEEL